MNTTYEEIPDCSIVIPVFNSEELVADVIERTRAYCESQGWSYEIIAVNDGSRDQSWEVVRKLADRYREVRAYNLLHNYGQHTALYCGFQQARGQYICTIDDDLQNPPEEMGLLMEKAKQGHDLVMGKFRKKEHAAYRRTGSRLIRFVNRHIFHQPDDLVLSNYRMIRKDVIERVCAYKTAYPYITGLVLWFSYNPANVEIEHCPRPKGKSNYTALRLLSLVARLIFNYSSVPLRVVSFAGFSVSAFSFLIGMFYLLKELLVGTTVPGWPTVVVLLSFVGAVNSMMLGMMGEYTVRLLNQTSSPAVYHIRERVDAHA